VYFFWTAGVPQDMHGLRNCIYTAVYAQRPIADLATGRYHAWILCSRLPCKRHLTGLSYCLARLLIAAAPNVEGFVFLAALLDGESPEALPQLTMSVLSHGLLGAAEFPRSATTVSVPGQDWFPVYRLDSHGHCAHRHERSDNANDYRCSPIVDWV